MIPNFMHNGESLVGNSPAEQYSHTNNQLVESSTQNQSNSTNIITSLKTQKETPMNPTPLEYSCWSTHPTATAVCAFVLYMIVAIAVGALTVYFTAPKPSKTCPLNFQRTMKSSIIPGLQTRSAAVADLNNDHQMDIVVANSGVNTIGIFVANGNGTFADVLTYSTGLQSRPYSIVISDFNNDNCLDIAIANYGTNNIGILFGNGNGTFVDQNVFSLGSSRPLFVTIGDLNKDNRTDIVVANYGTNTVGILLGYGNGSFRDQITYSTGYDSIPCSLAVGDFNKDNQLDIAVANYGTNNIGIFFGYNNGTFANQITYTTTPYSSPSSIAVGDFNNDDQLDIVVANNDTGNVGLFLGHGNGTFLVQTEYLIGNNSHPQFIGVGDFNNDNELDIVTVDSTNDQLYIILGYGNGSFATITTYNDTVSGSNPFSLAVADLNNNNQSDIVVVNYGTNNILVLVDYFIEPSARETNYHVTSQANTNSVAVSDFNDDHILDIAFNVGNSIAILLGLGNGTFGSERIYLASDGSAPQYICVGDLNNDNRVDIVSANMFSGSVGILLGHGDGIFSDMTSYSTGTDSNPIWVALGDFNHDYRLDIVSANANSNTIGILLGNGDGTFVTVVTYSTGYHSFPCSVAIGDIDNDTNLDVVVSDGAGSIIIFLGLGNGSFIIWTTYNISPGFILSSVALADFNSDNHLDIVVANTLNDNLDVFLGYGNGTFAAQTNYFTGSNSRPHYVIVTDFNNDNISDIAATNSNSAEVVIFYGYGNGSLELARTYSTGVNSNPVGIAAADLNNDNQLEIVVALVGIGDIAVLSEYDAVEFASKTQYSTGSAPQPFSVAVGDFNQDNRSDIVVANSGADNLDILLGAGNGIFSTNMMYSIGTNFQPHYVITCDINKDNQLDIVSVNSKNNSISVIMGYGNGSFAEQLIYSTGDSSYPYAAVSDDFNNDNWLDLVIANEGTNSIGIFFGFNYASFDDQVTYSSVGSLESYGIVIVDLNNDNYLDIVATFQWTGTIGILLGHGNGSFTDMIIYSVESQPQLNGLASGDFNNDGRSDIVVTILMNDAIGVLLGYGNGSFTSMMIYSTGNNSSPTDVVVGDLNNDGRSDIVVANQGQNNVGVLLGYGNGTFSVLQSYSTEQQSSPASVTVGDFNNDGNLDIAVANLGNNNVGVLLGYGNGTFRKQMTFSTGNSSSPSSVTVGDFNRDNHLDIAIANFNNNNIGVLLGYGNGTFADMIPYSTGAGSLPQCVRIGDFNNDNISDIVVANSGANSIIVLFGSENGSFLLGRPYTTGTTSYPYILAIGDFNNDSRLDITVTNSHSNSIGVFLGYDNEPFGSVTTYSTGDGSQPHSVAVSDLNNDGWSDVVVANYGTNNVGILLAHSNGSFDSMMIYSTGNGSAPYSVAVADFNLDTHVDIVVTNSETGNIAILLGYGNGTFAMGITYSTGTGSHPYTVAIGDFNNDNIPDLVIANSGTSTIFLLYGYGNGTFRNEQSYSLGYGYLPYSVAAKDLNQDNCTDIAIACYNTDHVEILIRMD